MAGVYTKYKRRISPYKDLDYSQMTDMQRQEIICILDDYFLEITHLSLNDDTKWTKILKQADNVGMVFTCMFELNKIVETKSYTKKQAEKQAVNYYRYLLTVVKNRLEEDDEEELSFEQKKELAKKDLERMLQKYCRLCGVVINTSGRGRKNTIGVCADCRPEALKKWSLK
jgi:hypothetical protein